MLPSLLIYAFGFVLMWLGAGLATTPISRIASSLKLSSFTLSFLVLGIATSMGEFSVGVNAIFTNDPEIYIGNLLGASLILFLFVIPFLALLGNKLEIDKELRGSNLPLLLGTVGLPALLSFDGVITPQDGGIMLVAYLFAIIPVISRHSIWSSLTTRRSSLNLFHELVICLIGVGIIFAGSSLVVRQTEYFANLLSVSPFLISLLVIGLGTNLPEIAVGVRSLFGGKKSLAFADYIGSAAFNTFLFGMFTLIVGRPILLTNSYWIPLLTTMLGLALFYVFAKSKNTVSRREALSLLVLYIGFLTAEVLK